jgi:hypothetical protein
LLIDGPLLTEPLAEEELPASRVGLWSRIVEGYEDAELPPTASELCITVVTSGRQVLFPLPVGEICLGRGDASNGISPSLDLASDGGIEAGVSRHHAKIYEIENRLVVEDAGSANGTFLNRQRLAPHLPYALREGDMLDLGRIQLLVSLNVRLDQHLNNRIIRN